MIMKTIVFSILALVALGIMILLAYSGFFASVKITEKQAGPFYLVYEEHIGDYRGTAEIQNRIYYSLLEDHSVETYKGFGIYYDDPKEVPTDQLRSLAGDVLESKDYPRIEELKEMGFQIMHWPERRVLAVEFPYRNGFSILAGIMKVHPKLTSYTQEHSIEKSAVMEIYDVPGKRIFYYMELSP